MLDMPLGEQGISGTREACVKKLEDFYAEETEIFFLDETLNK